MTVVGVAADVSSATGMPGQPLPIVYEPWRPRPDRAGYIAFVRAAGAQGVVTAAISSAMRGTLPDATVAVPSRSPCAGVLESSVFESRSAPHQETSTWSWRERILDRSPPG